MHEFTLTLEEALRSPLTSLADLEQIEREATDNDGVRSAARAEIERRKRAGEAE